MLEKILEMERGLFFLINSSHSPFWDQVMWLYSGLLIWLPFIIFFCFMLIYKKSWKEWLPVLGSILIIDILCILFSSFITKPLFARPRPIFHPSFMEDVRTLYESILEPYGFVSGHSAVSFGMALFTALLFRNRIYSIAIFVWAFIMAYSRVYLGVHFISDIVAGGLAGMVIGFLIYLLYHYYIKRYYSKRNKSVEPVYPSARGKILGIALLSYIALFTLLSGFFF